MPKDTIHSIARIAVAFVWIYQGAIPILVQAAPDRLLMLVEAGMRGPIAAPWVRLLSWCAIVLGAVLLLRWKARWPFIVTIVLMVVITLVVTLSSPHRLVPVFNPLAQNLLMIAMSVIGLLSQPNADAHTQTASVSGLEISSERRL